MHAAQLEQAIAAWSPTSDANIYGDAYKTLFVGRLAFETTEKRLQREFEEFGPVVRVRVVRDRHGNSRGYGFVEFANEDDLKVAYRRADGRKIDGRRILVDVERGRTVPAWRPRRLGGGLGDTRRAVPRKPRKKDNWVRPYLAEYRVISLATKQRIAADQQRAIDASLSSSAFGAGQKAAYGGYSAGFDRDMHRAERALYKAARAAAATAAAAARAEEKEREKAAAVAAAAGGKKDEGEKAVSASASAGSADEAAAEPSTAGAERADADAAPAASASASGASMEADASAPQAAASSGEAVAVGVDAGSGSGSGSAGSESVVADGPQAESAQAASSKVDAEAAAAGAVEGNGEAAPAQNSGDKDGDEAMGAPAASATPS